MYIKATIVKMQKEFQADIFGFGEDYYRSNLKQFSGLEEDWDTVFSDAEVEIESTFFIRRSGIRNKSFLTDEEKQLHKNKSIEEKGIFSFNIEHFM
ncbi:Ger(x)C family spore germination C-terminal domain-containing protein [Bacillus haimaensis]|uniref:Ger(x)C family spore germination C-terminal domain-containing protein n=1 Tax=Bacillus haimaensis TaxID=3160967 RepID=UPI003AA856A6